MKRLNSSDEIIRLLERRVLSGDLSAVPALARAYERAGKDQDLSPHPVVRQALVAAADVLATTSETAGDDDYWNVGGDGFRASQLLRLAEKALDGEDVDIDAHFAELEREAVAQPEAYRVRGTPGGPTAGLCGECDASIAVDRDTGFWGHGSIHEDRDHAAWPEGMERCVHCDEPIELGESGGGWIHAGEGLEESADHEAEA